MKKSLISKERSLDKTWLEIFHVLDDYGVFSLIHKGPFTPNASECENEIFFDDCRLFFDLFWVYFLDFSFLRSLYVNRLKAHSHRTKLSVKANAKKIKEQSKEIKNISNIKEKFSLSRSLLLDVKGPLSCIYTRAKAIFSLIFVAAAAVTVV